jgi:diguanylate cyclase (GGDEF)-like protein
MRVGGVSRRSKWVRQILLSLVAVVVIAVGLRVAASRAFLTATATTVLALGAFALGLWLHLRRHGRSWRVAWSVLGCALAVQVVATTCAAAVGLPSTYPASIDWISAVCAVAATAAVGQLLSTRARGRAIDALLEGSVLAVSCTYLAWAWAATRGIGQTEALEALVPLAAWILAVWILLRLIFLTKEHIVAYRYLAASFVCLLAVNAMFAGTRLGGSSLSRGGALGIALWAYCLWGAAAVHPSLRRTFEPTQPRSSRFGSGQLLLCLLATTLGPVTLALLASGHDLSALAGVLVGSAIAPGLLAIYLIRQVRARARAEYRAQHDPLTGLPNRTLFHDRVDVALSHARRSGTGVAVMFLDLDRFKLINDSLGHAEGNQLLQAVAKRLRETIRETDTVARMGGDEFTVLVGGIKEDDDAAVTAQKIVDQFAKPFVAGGRELHTTTSVGIALYPADGNDVDTLLKHADGAMYRAKARGRDTYEFFTPDLSVRAQARLSVESGLRHALERNGLELHYQPQIDVRSGAIVGLEALARWPHKGVGMVMPDVFVPIAEETGLIVSLGDWAIDEACSDLRLWLNAGIAPRPVAVNLSARQLSDPALVDKVGAVLERYDVPAHLLELEITESVFMRDLASSTATLKELRTLGVACSIDDFGTGFSGLSYLADMPIDSLKIDQSFVSRVRKFHDHAPIIEAIIGLARALNLNVVAEGVETVDQARFLAAHGCTEMQGYLFSPPRPFGDIAELLKLNDAESINWLGVPMTDDLVLPPHTPALAATEASTLLAALCDGTAVAGRDGEIVKLLAALLPTETKVPTPSSMRAASMRIAAGSFAGLVPISTGLAAAHVLPKPVESIIAAAYDTAGLHIPQAVHIRPDGELLIADSRSAFVASARTPEPGAGGDTVIGDPAFGAVDWGKDLGGGGNGRVGDPGKGGVGNGGAGNPSVGGGTGGGSGDGGNSGAGSPAVGGGSGGTGGGSTGGGSTGGGSTGGGSTGGGSVGGGTGGGSGGGNGNPGKGKPPKPPKPPANKPPKPPKPPANKPPKPPKPPANKPPKPSANKPPKGGPG